MRSETFRTLVLIISLLGGGFSQAENTNTLLIYPKVQGPLERIYQAIIQGIKTQITLDDTLAINSQTDPAQIQAIFKSQPVSVIALGRNTAEILNRYGYSEHMLVGATVFNANEYQGVSLGFDSRVLLHAINDKLPRVKRVFIVDQQNKQTITVYPESRQGSPEIITHYAPQPQAIVRELWRLLNEQATSTDAVIIPGHLDKDIVYELVQLAWRKKIILLSTNLSHLQQGVLMVFYPDNVGMGVQIGQLAAKAEKVSRYENLKRLHVALNETMAAHLGLVFEPDVLEQFQFRVK